jgi:hypothetical protein
MNLKFFEKTSRQDNLRDIRVYGRVALKRGHLQRTETPKYINQANVHQKRPKGRLKVRRKDDVENDIRTVGIVNWDK